jgi:hypothetical protein
MARKDEKDWLFLVSYDWKALQVFIRHSNGAARRIPFFSLHKFSGLFINLVVHSLLKFFPLQAEYFLPQKKGTPTNKPSEKLLWQHLGEHLLSLLNKLFL